MNFSSYSCEHWWHCPTVVFGLNAISPFNQKENNNNNGSPIFLVPISESIFKLQTVALTLSYYHHYWGTNSSLCMFVTICWVSSLLIMISDSHFSLYLHPKLIDLWFLFVMFDFSLFLHFCFFFLWFLSLLVFFL